MHQHPELSGCEQQTSLHLYQLLNDHFEDVRLGPDGRGVMVDINSSSDDPPRIALRADIDALHIQDKKDAEYRSQCDGVMHACGHDAHSAMVFGALSSIKSLMDNEQLPCDLSVRAIFQPAEETCRGAQEMIAVGAIDNVEAIIATHVDPTRDVGTVGVRTGVLTANCDEMMVSISGRGGHAARPHETSDSIAAAASLINALYLYIPRRTDSQDAVVVTIGQIYGGDNSNVIPEEVRLLGTVRTLDRSVRKQTFEHIDKIAQGIALTSGTEIKVEFGASAPSVQNHASVMPVLRSTIEGVVGATAVQEIPRPSMGSEDFAFYLDRVPGAMFRLGCRSDETGGHALHTPEFDIDERALLIGATIMARSVISWSLDQSTAG